MRANPDMFALVMIAATGWRQALSTAYACKFLEETWALLGNERVARDYQASQKLSRDYRVTNIAAAHRIARLRAQTDDGSAAANVSLGLLADTQTRILFRHPTDQVAEAQGGPSAILSVEAQLLPEPQRGRAL